MKISQLSSVSGEAISTIKFYIRVGLLPPGTATAKNQARYDESHVGRLALISILKEELGLSIESMVEAFATTSQPPPVSALRKSRGQAQGDQRDVARGDSGAGRKDGAALTEVLLAARDFGWLVEEGDPALEQVARSVAVISRLLPAALPRDYLGRYARAANEMALQEIEYERPLRSKESLDPASLHVLQTCAFEPLLLGLRRLARGQRLAQLREMDEADRDTPARHRSVTQAETGSQSKGPDFGPRARGRSRRGKAQSSP